MNTDVSKCQVCQVYCISKWGHVGECELSGPSDRDMLDTLLIKNKSYHQELTEANSQVKILKQLLGEAEECIEEGVISFANAAPVEYARLYEQWANGDKTNACLKRISEALEETKFYHVSLALSEVEKGKSDKIESTWLNLFDTCKDEKKGI